MKKVFNIIIVILLIVFLSIPKFISPTNNNELKKNANLIAEIITIYLKENKEDTTSFSLVKSSFSGVYVDQNNNVIVLSTSGEVLSATEFYKENRMLINENKNIKIIEISVDYSLNELNDIYELFISFLDDNPIEGISLTYVDIPSNSVHVYIFDDFELDTFHKFMEANKIPSNAIILKMISSDE